ncbi:MAG: ABC transporter permease [Acetivibrio sp.]
MIRIKKLIGYGILALAGALCMAGSHTISQNLTSQQAAERWSSDGEKYAQISAFFTKDAAASESSINNYRSSIRKTLEEASIKAKHKNGRLWIDAYSGNGSVEITRKKSKQKVKIVGVGGDFFLFHPLNMLDGYYFSPTEVMKDRLVLEEEVAWQLFGSTDVEGMSVTIGEKSCKVAGVYRREKGKQEADAYGSSPAIFAPYELLMELNGKKEVIDCYEMLLPNPVKGFAWQKGLKCIGGVDLSTNTGSETDLSELPVEILENSNRFQPINLIKVLENMGSRSMQRKNIEYPYWENIARAKENIAAIRMLLSFIFFIVPLVVLIQYGIKRFKNRKWTFERVKVWVLSKVEERKKKKWEEKRNEEEKYNH